MSSSNRVAGPKQWTRSAEKSIRTFRNEFMRWLFSSRKGRKIALEALSPQITALTMDCGDHVISFSPHELVGRTLYASGDFERARVGETLTILEREKLIPPGGLCVIEIGANIGTQSVYFALSDQVSRVVAVEPDPRNLLLLNRNVAENGLGKRIAIVQCAISDREGEAELFRSLGNHGASSLLPRAVGDGSVRVRMATLDTVLAEAGVAADEISLLWMDIEGAEPVVCRSMIPLLKRQVPLMMEFSPDLYGEGESRDFIEFLYGYYRRCVVFDRSGRHEATPEALPVSGKQVDVLFLPDAKRRR